MSVPALPFPNLAVRQFDGLQVLTDDALFGHCGVRVAFAGRRGGVSLRPYSGLNVATHVGDVPDAVQENRLCLQRALGAQDMPLICPNQVHGTDLVCIDRGDAEALREASRTACAGADGLIVTVARVAALLCFADCVPVVIASPTGAFAVVHAGWRGVVASIAPQAARKLACRESQGADAPFSSPEEALAAYNVYFGPYIHAECFETGAEVAGLFVQLAGSDCVTEGGHVDLGRALATDLARSGISLRRICDAGICTACRTDAYYSYRAEGGTCGRHGALAFRKVDYGGN